jgi:hypothetical protein
MQQCAVHILYFTARLLYMFRVPFTPIMSTRNCSRRPLVKVISRSQLDGAASSPLDSVRQATNTLHRGQVQTVSELDHGVVASSGVKT